MQQDSMHAREGADRPVASFRDDLSLITVMEPPAGGPLVHGDVAAGLHSPRQQWPYGERAPLWPPSMPHASPQFNMPADVRTPPRGLQATRCPTREQTPIEPWTDSVLAPPAQSLNAPDAFVSSPVSGLFVDPQSRPVPNYIPYLAPPPLQTVLSEDADGAPAARLQAASVRLTGQVQEQVVSRNASGQAHTRTSGSVALQAAPSDRASAQAAVGATGHSLGPHRIGSAPGAARPARELGTLACPVTRVAYGIGRHQPLLLPCGHDVCRGALHHLNKDGPGSSLCKCPLCQRDFDAQSPEPHALLQDLVLRFRAGQHTPADIAAILETRKFDVDELQARRGLTCEGRAEVSLHESRVDAEAYVVKEYCGPKARHRSALWELQVLALLAHRPAAPVVRMRSWSNAPGSLVLRLSKGGTSLATLVRHAQHAHKRAGRRVAGLSARDAIIIGWRLARALVLLHELPHAVGQERDPPSLMGVIHGGLTPKKVLVDEAAREVLVCGLAHASLIRSSGSDASDATGALGTNLVPPPDTCNSRAFRAPEVAAAMPASSTKVDVWGVGAVLLFALTGAIFVADGAFNDARTTSS